MSEERKQKGELIAMHKELIICIILVILIVIGDWVTQNYTKNTVDYITGELENLKQNLLEKSDDKVDEDINKIDDNKVIVSKLTEYGEDDGEAILKKENIDTISFLGVDEEDIQLLKRK